MSVNRAAIGRKKPTAGKEPMLIVSFQLNKPTRPKMTIYEDSDIPTLINEFIKQHKLKSTAAAIISNVINKNIAQMREEQQRTKAKTTSNKSLHGKQSSRRIDKPNNKENIRSNPPEEPQPKNKAPTLTKLLQEFRNNDQCQQVGMAELQEQFERQFKTIRANRMLRGCQKQLSNLYYRLTRLNPADCSTIDPDYIDFSSFDGRLLQFLEQFFSKLEEDDFVGLDYHKFRELIEKHQCNGLVQLLTEETE